MASSRSSAPSAAPLKGFEQPRIFTPPLRELTTETTVGFALIEFASEVLGITLLPWQKWLALHALELLPDGTFRFRTVILLVARQNGKSTFLQVLSLFFMYVRGVALVIGTAQNLDIAEEVWQGAVDIAQDVPDLAAEIRKVNLTNGKKSLELVSGERYKVQAASRRGGRGLSGDLVLMDELREHQSWDAWGAVTKTTLARMYAQIWAASNAGDASSIVLRYLRKMAHMALGDPDGLRDATEAAPDEDVDLEGDSLGIFEWSAAPGSSLDDPAGRAQANPSQGYTITERAILSARMTDPEWVYRTECLCQWSDGSLEGPFPPGSWEAGQDPDSARADGAEVVACIDVSHDRGMSHITIAARRPDGKIHVEVVASRAGTEWLRPWFYDADYPHRAKWKITGQTNGAPVSSVLEDLKAPYTAPGEARARPLLEIVPWAGPDLARASGGFYDLVRGLGQDGKSTPGVYHRPSPVLDVPAATAVTKPLGDGWAWDRRKSPTDISALVAATGAVWLLTRPVESTTSVYEERGMVTL